MVPGLMTVMLLSIVAVWNNYFLPLVIFSKQNLYPITVGLGLWAQHGGNSGAIPLFPLVITGGLITIIPVIALFLVVQRYWKGGMLLGSLTG
jgi:multiple sugar transport system permease protein